MKIYSIPTENFKLDGGAMFGVVPKVLWQKVYPADENNLCNWAMRCMLVDDGERKILIDTGIGYKQDHKFLRHYYLHGDDTLLKSLAKHGYSPESITDVVHTHLHFDHCGGTIKYDENKKLVPTFPNANLWVSRQHWETATNPNRREKASFLKENILPMQESGKLKLIEEEGELFPNFFVKFYHGHTAGQIVPIIKYNGKKLVYGADLFPAAAHIPAPYIMAYDMCAYKTLEERRQFYAEAIENDYTMFFEHDYYNECCNFHETPKGVAVKDVFSLEEFLK